MNVSFSNFSRFRKSLWINPIVLNIRSRPAELGESFSNLQAKLEISEGKFPI